MSTSDAQVPRSTPNVNTVMYDILELLQEYEQSGADRRYFVRIGVQDDQLSASSLEVTCADIDSDAAADFVVTVSRRG